MKYSLLAIFIVVCNISLCFSQYAFREFWNERGELVVNWHSLNPGQKAFVLDKYRAEINYCVDNLGRRFEDVDISRIGSSRGYQELNTIGSGLIALKYQDEYLNPIKSITYFEMAWYSFKKCKKQNTNSYCDWPFNDESPLDFILGVANDAGMYQKALKYYPEAYKDIINRLSISTDIKLLKSDFKKYRKNWPEDAQSYQEFIAGWNRAKHLAKTAKPKPLDPAVQNHEWFYNDKQEEVLKALEYYHANKVQFMLEKALKHKDSVIATKAKEYLESLAKGIGDEKAK